MILRLLRIALLIVGVWALGFLLFLATLGSPLQGRKTDAIVVLTGGAGRIDRGVELMRLGSAKKMLVSGVDRNVRRHEFAAEYKIEQRLMACCIDLGHEAVDTRSNAKETAEWVRAHNYKTVRLVTADWHMPRARLELAHQLGKQVALVGDPVKSDNARPFTIFSEYNKYLVRSLAMLFGA